MGANLRMLSLPEIRQSLDDPVRFDADADYLAHEADNVAAIVFARDGTRRARYALMMGSLADNSSIDFFVS